MPSTTLKLGLTSSAWATISHPEPFPLANDGAALTFEFPTTGSMHYLYTGSPKPAISGTLSITMRVTTTGPVTFIPIDQTDCSIPPSVRPFFWSNDSAFGEFDRWWSNPRAFALAPGTTTLSVPIRPENFSSVLGKYGNSSSEVQFQFEKALLNVTRIGLTFGGGCSFGHGIYISGGRAQFTLTDYSIQ